MVNNRRKQDEELALSGITAQQPMQQTAQVQTEQPAPAIPKAAQQNVYGGYQQNPYYTSALEDAYNKAYNRDPFTYNADNDQLYQQWKNNYMENGRKAMADTVGNAALLTGGYGNSYGQVAGQQVYNQYAENAADKGEEFRNNAYNQWLQEGQMAQDAYAAMRQRENDDYNRYMDAYNMQYQRDRDAENDRRYNQEFDYQKQRDAENDRRYNQEFDYQKQRDAVSDKQYQDKMDQAKQEAQYDYQIQLLKNSATKNLDKEFDPDDVLKFIESNKDKYPEDVIVDVLFQKYSQYGDGFMQLMKSLGYFDVLKKRYPNQFYDDRYVDYSKKIDQGNMFGAPSSDVEKRKAAEAMTDDEYEKWLNSRRTASRK